jgi:hypothetical protein
LYNLTKKEVPNGPWPWSAACQASFEGLKEALCSAPVLALPDYTKPFEIISDASVHGIGAVLLQDNHPVAYLSKKFTSAEYNYDTGEQELLGVVHALKAFRCYVEGNEFKLITDHQPLTYLNDQPRLSRKHARWYEFLQTFKFTWEHRKGRDNVADPLSRIPGVETLLDTSKAVAPRAARHLLCAIRPKAAQSSVALPDDAFLTRVAAAYARDPWYNDIDAKAGTYGLTRERGVWWRERLSLFPMWTAYERKFSVHATLPTPVGISATQK